MTPPAAMPPPRPRHSPGQLARDIRARIAATRSTRVPVLRVVRREISRELKPRDPAFVIDVALQLLRGENKRGDTAGGPTGAAPKWFAYELVHYHRQALAGLTLRTLEQLAAGLSGWDEVDPFACYLSGPAWRQGRISDAAIRRWSRSSDRWIRRAAVVSTVALNNTARGGAGDAARTLAVCERVLHDRDDMVVKAVSWALRELASKDAPAVRRFITKHDKVLAARIRREVRNKLETGIKNVWRLRLRRK